MSTIADRLLALARQHMGLAASAYITAELRALGRGRAQIDATVLQALAERARTSALRFMSEGDADAFVRGLEGLADEAAIPASDGEVVEHKLALDAAGRLLARGDSRRAFLAYRELAEQHGDAASFRGVARSALANGDIQMAIDALREAALRLVQGGDRDQAISLLEEAIGLAPVELSVHRRLVALYANAGDVTSAKCEHARFIEACLAAGDAARAGTEIAYARQTIGDSAALRDLERRLAAPRAAAPAGPASALAPAVLRPAPVPRTAPAAVIPVEPDTVGAAQDLIRRHQVRAAADLLLGQVAGGIAGRDVQRLLISVARELGRRDIAAEKAGLLARLLELDGDPSGAGEVGRLALAS